MKDSHIFAFFVLFAGVVGTVGYFLYLYLSDEGPLLTSDPIPPGATTAPGTQPATGTPAPASEERTRVEKIGFYVPIAAWALIAACILFLAEFSRYPSGERAALVSRMLGLSGGGLGAAANAFARAPVTRLFAVFTLVAGITLTVLFFTHPKFKAMSGFKRRDTIYITVALYIPTFIAMIVYFVSGGRRVFERRAYGRDSRSPHTYTDVQLKSNIRRFGFAIKSMEAKAKRMIKRDGEELSEETKEYMDKLERTKETAKLYENILEARGKGAIRRVKPAWIRMSGAEKARLENLNTRWSPGARRDSFSFEAYT